MIDDDGTDGSSYVWTIQNFSYCLHKPGEYLESPTFVLYTNDTDWWRLRLYPRGEDNTNFSDFKTIGFSLYLEKNSMFIRSVEYVLSIQNISGLFKTHNEIDYEFSKSEDFGLSQFLTKEELRGKGHGAFLRNDTMTLRCRIRKVDGKSLPPVQCYMRTIINVERATNILSPEKFQQNRSTDELTTKLRISLQMQSFIAVKLLSRRDYLSGNRINLEIKQINNIIPCFFTCDLSLLDDNGKVTHSIREEHRFDASEFNQVWSLPYIPLNKLLDYGKINLRCELAVSSGIQYSWVERVENSDTDNHQPTRLILKKELDCSDSLKNDLQRYYSDGMLTDFIIRTSSKEFPVHKAIISARSTVFHGMIERDMQESRTGVVNIEDIDAHTVHRMLLFAYSDVVEDLDCDVASKLYFAAAKYRINALRRKCSNFLKENLSVSNVCKVTVLANVHQDEDLKSFAQDFIVEHAAEVMRSVEWMKFVQGHVLLHSETMHVLHLRNLNN